jgi:KDO2-lipid IV(A) lauroyltransferase
MKNFTDRITTYFLVLLAFISGLLNRKLRMEYGKLLGLAIFLISKKRREITYSNIKAAFPEMQKDELKRISFKSFQNLGITFAELFALKGLTENELEDYISFPGIDEIKEVFSREKGIILLSAHFGNWELMAYSFGFVSNIPTTIIVKPQKNKFADKYLNDIRTHHGNKIVSMHRSAFEIVKKVKSKEAVALLADQAAQKGKDIFVEFFGRKASTYEAPAQLALKFRVPIIMGFSIRQPDGRYIVETRELKFDHIDDSDEGIKELTKLHVKLLEDYIRKYPEQWVWQHRRWKHTPQD